ncbi:MAG TPA: proton-conducting transporter membrane subunit, partial [Niastella sp.]|nr:proton-conducting transporter membrane subunit [Niastella sp.]
MATLLLLIPLLPFFGFMLAGLGRNFLPKGAVSVIGCGTVLGSFIISLLLFFRLDALTALSRIDGKANAYIASYFEFIHVGNLNIPFAFQVDALSVLFLLIITGVGFLIHVYSAAYMHGERRDHFARYFSYLNLFVFSMLLLVLGANYVIMFIGWEGVGLCSYLLIGYWFKNVDYTKAAK